MGKRSIGPWFREDRGWFVTHRGEQIKLADADATEAEARDLWARWVSRGRPGRSKTPSTSSDEITAKEVVDRYLVRVSAERAESTSDLAKRYLLPWAESLPADLLAAGLSRDEPQRVKSYDVDQWIRTRYTKPGAARIARQIIKAAWNWAISDGRRIDRMESAGGIESREEWAP